jgi:hypothetical protein
MGYALHNNHFLFFCLSTQKCAYMWPLISSAVNCITTFSRENVPLNREEFDTSVAESVEKQRFKNGDERNLLQCVAGVPQKSTNSAILFQTLNNSFIVLCYSIFSRKTLKFMTIPPPSPSPPPPTN